MKHCKKCNIQIDRDVNYCSKCGTKLSDVMEAGIPKNTISPDFKPTPGDFKSQYNDLMAYCDYCGKPTYLPFKGRYGRYYCEDHHLPENRGEGSHNKPPTGYRVIYHSHGKTEYKK